MPRCGARLFLHERPEMKGVVLGVRVFSLLAIHAAESKGERHG